MTTSNLTPWYARSESRNMLHPEGLVRSMGAGRTDIHNISVPAGSYVIPADVTSGLAEGNTLAGAGVMDRIMHSNPFGISGGIGKGKGVHPPKMKFAKGGQTGAKQPELVPIVVAGGEMIYYPQTIEKKFGNLEQGHATLDAFVRKARAANVATLGKLPGPKK